MRKALLMGLATLVLSVQDARAAQTEQQWLTTLQQSEQSLGKNSPQYAELLFAVGNFYHTKGDHQKDQPMFSSAMNIFEKSPGTNSGLLRFYSDALARVYTEEGKYSQAEPLFKRAITLGDKLPGKDNTHVVPHSLGGLAELYMAQDRFPEAESALKRRIQMRARFMNAGQVDVANTELVNLYVKWGKLDQAKSVIDELLTMSNTPQAVKDAVAMYSAAKNKQTATP